MLSYALWVLTSGYAIWVSAAIKAWVLEDLLPCLVHCMMLRITDRLSTGCHSTLANVQASCRKVASSESTQSVTPLWQMFLFLIIGNSVL